jgi:dTDP-4-amino-4,6-dideoxygalactose transaminase
MPGIDFFSSALPSLHMRTTASYQAPDQLRGIQAQCTEAFKKMHGLQDFHLTKSCTQSLEIALAALPIPRGSEIILPSYAFVSCANAIQNYGHQCVFVDCDPRTMNIAPDAIAGAISPLTKAVMTINYGGLSCDYASIREICRQYELYLIEDNAHGFLAKNGADFLGTFGDVSTISFDHMKNISCEEGGGISVNNPDLYPFFRTVLEFGTNRADYFEGKVKEYEWKSAGSNCYLAESLAEMLYQQILDGPAIISALQKNWALYRQLLLPLELEGHIQLANFPDTLQTNGHIFWLKTKTPSVRSALIQALKAEQIFAAFHYSALHQSEYGKKVGIFRGEDRYTTIGSQTLARLPQHHFLTEDQIFRVAEIIYRFYHEPFPA